MEARAIQRSARQSARKMRLVIDLIRGRAVPEAYAILKFSKKLAAKQIHKVLQSAVANAEQKALRQNEAFDADRLRVKYAVINEGQTLKRSASNASFWRNAFCSALATADCSTLWICFAASFFENFKIAYASGTARPRIRSITNRIFRADCRADR